MRHLRRHADAFAQLGVEMDDFADVHSVCAHLDAWSSVKPTQATSWSVRLSLTAMSKKVLYKVHFLGR
jgi:hypothetical protein